LSYASPAKYSHISCIPASQPACRGTAYRSRLGRHILRSPS